MATKKNFPVFDCDSHVVEPAASGGVRASKVRAWAKTSSASTPTGISADQRPRGPRRARALERRRSRLGALGQKEVGRSRRNAGMAAEIRPPARLPRPPCAAHRHDALGTDQVMLFRPGSSPGTRARPDAAGILATPTMTGLRLLRATGTASSRARVPLQSVEISIAEPAASPSSAQGGGGAAVLLERALSDLARIRSAVPRDGGAGPRAGDAHFPSREALTPEWANAGRCARHSGQA